MMESTKSPRVEACIADCMARFPGESERASLRYFEAVHQELAPLARELEADLAAAQAERDEANKECGFRIGERDEARAEAAALRKLAEAIAGGDGDDCEQCGVYLGKGEGFTRLCEYCRKHSADPIPNEKTTCPKCKKRVKASGLKDHMRDAHGVKL